MKVTYVHGKPGIHTGNILWKGRFPMRYGKFPSEHPCFGMEYPSMCIGRQRVALEKMSGGSDGSLIPKGSLDALGKFRALGYEASCFPEGDGITMLHPEGKSEQEAIEDIKTCFGWDVETL